jgi:hypothetical protein
MSDVESCASLSSAVGLAIALAIDPEASLGAAATSSSSASSASASASVSASASSVAIEAPSSASIVPSASSAPPPAPSSSSSQSQAPRAVLDARAGLVTGLVPRVAAAIDVGAEGAGPIRPRLAALYVPETTTVDGAVGFGLTAAALSACATLAGDDVVSLSACAGGLVGAIHAFVHDLTPVKPGDRLWVAGGAEVDARLRLAGPFALVGGLSAVFPFTRHRFLADGKDAVLFQQPFVTLLGTLGLAISL